VVGAPCLATSARGLLSTRCHHNAQTGLDLRAPARTLRSTPPPPARNFCARAGIGPLGKVWG
jgi:hypothetical protein